MPSPAKGYRLRDGTKVPGVTTILGRFKDSGGLIWWANRLALDPLLRARHLLEAAVNDGTAWKTDATAFLAINPESWDHKLAAGKAADAGTVAHEMFDCYVKGIPFATFFPASAVDAALPAFEAAKTWAAQSRFSVIETEVPLVSEKHRFGGTRDAILIGDKRAIGDWKTSRGVFLEHLAQLAAYQILDEEAGNTIDGGLHLLRFSKQEKPNDPIHFVHHHWDQLEVGKRYFLLLREAYDVAADLARFAK